MTRTGVICNGHAQTYASFNLPTLLSGPGTQSALRYGPERQRWRQIASYANGTETTHYVGEGLLEKVHATSTGHTYFRHYVETPGGQRIVVSRNSNYSGSKVYQLTDHLGSTETVLDAAGGVYTRQSFAAFGGRRGSDWTAGTLPDLAGIANTSRHGYTGHEHLDNLALIHMGGRVYDPQLGRFLSVDPLIGDLTDSQSVNPYAYVGNRPLSYTDPTGLLADGGCVSTGWCAAVLSSVGATFANFFGGSKPPPPPASALPGISAQNGVAMCGPGTFSPTCGGMVLYAGAPSGGAEGVPTSSWAGPRGEPGAAAAAAAYNWIHTPGLSNAVKYGAPALVLLGSGVVLICASSAPACTLAIASADLATLASGEAPMARRGVVAVKSASRVSDAARKIEDWLGPGAKTIRNDAGDLVAVSRDGSRRVRFDVNRPYPHENPHGHVEELINGRWVKSGPIFPKDVTPK